jgi:hypothetical protein
MIAACRVGPSRACGPLHDRPLQLPISQCDHPLSRGSRKHQLRDGLGWRYSRDQALLSISVLVSEADLSRERLYWVENGRSALAL